MMPDKIYVREYPDRINQFWDREKRDDVVGVIYHGYIRKDAILEWAKEKYNEYKQMDEDFQGDVFLGNRHALAEVIQKIESL